jgi:two-component system sensor histidine kinase/response regulator
MTRILVIEDMKPLLEDIQMMLGLEGFEVLGAENGLVGVQRAREWRPDLIICDIMMPELDGYGVLAELQKDPTQATIPFIFLTARGEKSDIRQGMGSGADDYLTKPFTISELMNSVNARLERQALLTELANRRLDDLREQIIVALPHELRTPLSSILGYSDILAEDAPRLDAAQVAKMSQAIKASGLRLWRLIENYLLYAQIEISRIDPEQSSSLSYGQVGQPSRIIATQAISKAQQVNRQADLQLDLADEIAFLGISEEHLSKMIDELVDNAFKFSSAGTPVSVSAVVEAPQYVMRVSNQGRGMTQQQIASIGAYMQFGRKLHEQQGSGLGLIIAKRLAELHSGMLTIESVPDQVTTVCVALPLRD